MGIKQGMFNRFGRYVVLEHGVAEPPISVGRTYHLSLEGGNFIRIGRNFEDGFRFKEYGVREGKYVPISQGRVADLNWRKLLDTKL